jgi:DNA-binding XRE family transcriptional regulator
MRKRTRMPVRNLLKQVRRRHDLAIYGLSALSKVSPTIISAVERWDYCPSAEVRQRIAVALGVDIAEIWPLRETHH